MVSGQRVPGSMLDTTGAWQLALCDSSLFDHTRVYLYLSQPHVCVYTSVSLYEYIYRERHSKQKIKNVYIVPREKMVSGQRPPGYPYYQC